MKNLIALVALTLSLGSFATSIITQQTGELVNLNLDLDFAKSEGLEKADFATVLVDYIEEEVVLVIERPWSCPDGMFCATVMPAPVIIKLPLVSVEVDGCGFVQIKAELNEMPVDGIKETIEITDYSTGTCEIVVVNPLVVTFTEAWINRKDAEYVERVSYLYGFQGLN